MSNIRFSQLPTVQLLKDSDILAISSPDTSTPPVYTSVKAPVSQVAAKIVEETTFTTSLNTTNKTVAGSINETLSNFANDYSTSSAYAVGDCVLYAGSIYQCTTAIPSGEAWDSTHWTQIKAVDVGSGGGGSSTLAELSDVTLSSPSDGQVLKYDSTSQKWVNGTGGGSGGDHVTLTQAEYDALVQAGTVDPNAFYFITDTNGDGQDFQPIIYSDTEREIGVWRDGKPLYEKCIVLNNGTDIEVSNSGWTNTGVTFAGVQTVLGCFGVGSNGAYQGDMFAYTNNDILMLQTPRNSNEWVAIVAIRYIKTADQAGSGTWTPQGVPTHHYSTDEQIVGTWVDGSTLYEKTYEITSSLALTANTWTQTSFAQDNINRITMVRVSDSSGACADNLACGFVSDYIALNSARNVQFNDTSYMTIQYTKTSS